MTQPPHVESQRLNAWRLSSKQMQLAQEAAGPRVQLERRPCPNIQQPRRQTPVTFRGAGQRPGGSLGGAREDIKIPIGVQEAEKCHSYDTQEKKYIHFLHHFFECQRVYPQSFF